MATCFMCNRPATTKEHIPPKCFFPNFKDLKKDHRRNLITVKACREHNLSTSKDDEYLFVVICTYYENNLIGDSQAHVKVHRALKNSRGLYRQFFGPGKCGSVTIDGMPLRTAPVDKERFSLGMEKIGRGIYFHHFRCKWPGSVSIETPSLYPLLNRSTPYEWVQFFQDRQKVMDLSEQPMLSEPKHGSNPEIFYYQLLTASEHQPAHTFIRMVFYEGFRVLALMTMGE